MIDLKNIKRLYFLGIGGIGMSALARYFKWKGAVVAGYDKTRTALTNDLETEGIAIHYEDKVDLVLKDAELVVYTPAVPEDHEELNWFRSNNYPMMKRSEVLGKLSSDGFAICVGGTHGKTTITTMVAHLLRHSGFGCNAFLGGISANYDTNFWGSDKNVFVIEADEYDRSFHRLDPDIAVISSIDPDHLDIYGSEESVQEAFVIFGNRVKRDGTLIRKAGLPEPVQAGFKVDKQISYALKGATEVDAFATAIHSQNGGYRFDAILKDEVFADMELFMGGLHNIENAVAAITVARIIGISRDAVQSAIASFKGVKRRFEYIIAPAAGKGLVFIDDYAHHPAELNALLNGAKQLFPEHYCVIIFQPHLFSRTRDLAEGFAKSLAQADQIILLPFILHAKNPLLA